MTLSRRTPSRIYFPIWDTTTGACASTARSSPAELVTIGAEDRLAGLFAQTKDPHAAAGILEVFADSDSDAGFDLAKTAMRHDEPLIRQAAIKTAFAIGGDEFLPEVLAHLKRSSAPDDLRGCEEALLSRNEDPEHNRSGKQCRELRCCRTPAVTCG